MVWIGVANDTNALYWEWKLGALVDPYNDREKAAPCELLKVYRYKCSTGCKNS